MATISPADRRSSLFSLPFTPAQKLEMQKDDYAAGRNVSSILIAVVGAAMLAGMLIVAWIAMFAR